jgi:hypothetical protein
LNPDFSEMLSALSDAGVEFLVVGAYALAAHGLPRATGDIDIWVRPSPENAARVWEALRRFGAPTRGVTVSDFTLPDIVFQIGVPPRRVDILTSISGVEFEQAWTQRQAAVVDGLMLNVPSREHLIANKRAAGRPKDLADASWLESEER